MYRLFVGVELPLKLQNEIHKIYVNFPDCRLKPVDKDKLHITLKFMGDIEESDIHNIVNVLSTITFEPFEVELRGTGVFPHIKYPKVLWIGIEDKANKLNELANRIGSSLHDLAQDKANEFSPHVTISRIKENCDKIRPFLEKYDGVSFGKFKISNFQLIRSRLTKQGPIYYKIHSF